MSIFKSLVDKMKGKRAELEKQAAKRAAEAVLAKGTKAAKGALDSAGRVLESALFGDEEAPPPKADAPAEARPDPFASLKAAEAARSAAKAEAAKKEEDEIDAELAAMKKRLGK